MEIHSTTNQESLKCLAPISGTIASSLEPKATKRSRFNAKGCQDQQRTVQRPADCFSFVSTTQPPDKYPISSATRLSTIQIQDRMGRTIFESARVRSVAGAAGHRLQPRPGIQDDPNGRKEGFSTVFARPPSQTASTQGLSRHHLGTTSLRNQAPPKME